MDHIAQWISASCVKQGKTPERFGDLLAKVGDSRVRAALGSEVADILGDVSWFATLRNLRDRGVHFGASTIVIPTPEEGIRFQIYASFPFNRPLVPIENPENEFQEFRTVAAGVVGRIVLLLNELAVALQKVRAVAKVDGGYISAPGFDDFLEWCGTIPSDDEASFATAQVLIGEGESRSRVTEIDSTSFAYTRSIVYLPLAVGRKLISAFGDGYGERRFDLLRGDAVFTNCQIVETSVDVRMVSANAAFAGGHFAIEFDKHLVAAPSDLKLRNDLTHDDSTGT